MYFRSFDTAIYPFFRYLEKSIISDRPVDSTHWDVANGKYLPHAASQGAIETGVAKSEQEIEATARELYSVLGIRGDFVPQSELGLTGL